MGRMVSMFDLNLGVSTNKLLTEKPHRDGLDLSRNWLDLSSKTLQPSEHIEDKPISHESRSSLNNVANGTPMKMLLAQEMSKGDSKQKPPNVVARLMGLDAIPALEPLSQSDRSQLSPVFERNKYESYSRSSKEKYHEQRVHIPIQVDTAPPETSIRRQCQGNGLKEKRSLPAVRSHFSVYEEESRDVHEVRLSSTKERSNNLSLQKSYNDNLNEKRIDLVRQKFMEAKRLATDEKLRQSKEFQDALEVLSSNRELFLEFLQEPASLFAKRLDNLQSLQSIPPQSQSKRITVLKPSKAAIENGSWKQLNSSERVITSELKNDRLHINGETANRSTKKQHLIESKGPNENEPPWTFTFDHQSICHVRPQEEPDNLSHLTRIVVLKPSPQMVQDIRRVVASPPLSPKPHSRVSRGSTLERFMDASADENKDLQVREINSQMHESTSCHSLHSSSAREEPLFSSVLSNDYVGYESSHSRSENERVGDNLSDSEVMTPTSRYSWDFVNRCNSYSSSLSRASYSPESSVSKEAKRRLSERWALMAHGNKERQLRRSSSTLGEMLSIPELKEAPNSVGDTSEEVVGTSGSRSHAEHGNECRWVSSSKTDFSPKRNLSRSRSVPASLRTFETLQMEHEAGKSEQLRPIAKVEKPKNVKSFKGKLSSLFFSKNQKTSREKCDPVPLLGKAQAGISLKTDVSMSDYERQLATTSNCGNSAFPLSNSHEQCVTTGSSSSPIIEPKGDRSMEAILSQPIPKSRERLLENQEQPSPVSVLEPPFEDESSSPPGMESNISDQGTRRLSLLDSVDATLSSDDPNLEDGRLADRGTAEEDPATAVDEHNRFLFVKKLIAAAGLDGQYPFTAAISDKWYSSNGPLYPSLLGKLNEQDKGFSATNTKDAVSGGTKLQQVWLERRFLFNCVNAALLDIGQLALGENPWLRTSGTTKGVVPSGNALVEEVWRRLKKNFVVEEMAVTLRAAEGRDCVDKLLKRELETTGSDWMDLQLVEIDGIGREIQNGLLNDLIEDVISDMHSCCHKPFM